MITEKQKYDKIYKNDFKYENTKNLYGSLCHAFKVINFIDNLDFKNILDIGCGRGQFEKYLKEKGKKVYACDISSELINKLDIKGVDFRCASIHNLPYEDESFDIVTSFEVLEHIPKDFIEKAISEIARVTRNKSVVSVAWHRDFKWDMELHMIIENKDWWIEKFSQFFEKIKIIKENTYNMFLFLEKK